MNTTIGKIARLPRAVRDELNRRLRDGEQSRQLVAWLNGLPAVQAMLQDEFGGKPINEPNLTVWKQGGHRIWLARQEDLEIARDQAGDAAELAAAGPVADNLSRVLIARYAAFFARWNGDPASVNRRELATLHTLCEDVTQLRRGEHSAARLQLERQEQAWRSRSGETEALRIFLEWIRLPSVKELINRPGLTEEQKIRRMRKKMRAHLEMPADENGEDEDLEKAKAEEAKAMVEVEQASGELFRTAPPGLPTLAQLDERLKARPENAAQRGGVSKEVMALINKALWMDDGEDSGPATPSDEPDDQPADPPAEGDKN